VQTRHDDEIDTAFVEVIGAANVRGSYPTVAEVSTELRRRGLSQDDIAAAADRLYRGQRIAANSDGGLCLEDGRLG
jgi:hypothetical protein